MANVTEQDIIDHLKEKIKFHQKETKRLENVLSAFVSDSSPSVQRNRKAKPEGGSETSEAESEKEAPDTPQQLKAIAGKEPAPQTQTLEIPAKYTDTLPIEGKIAFALNEIGAGFIEDIANAMAQYEPKSDAKKIGRQISGILITLKEQGQLKSEKDGRKDRFSLAG